MLLLAYVASSTFRVVTTKLADLHEVTNQDGSLSDFRHPVFQTMVGFVGELFVACLWAIAFMLQ